MFFFILLIVPVVICSVTLAVAWDVKIERFDVSMWKLVQVQPYRTFTVVIRQSQNQSKTVSTSRATESIGW